MELSLVIEKLGKLANVGEPVREGQPCVLWFNGIVAYAYCILIEADYAINWYNCWFFAFDRLPPVVVSWKITHDHLCGDQFNFEGVPMAIIPLDLKMRGSNEIKEIDWDEFLRRK